MAVGETTLSLVMLRRRFHFAGQLFDREPFARKPCRPIAYPGSLAPRFPGLMWRPSVYSRDTATRRGRASMRSGLSGPSR
jgi:hypothetical protein